MGSIYNKYVKLKEKDEKYLYLFNSGNFYIFLDEDAIEVSRVTLLKLTNYSNDIYKCGFPFKFGYSLILVFIPNFFTSPAFNVFASLFIL